MSLIATAVGPCWCPPTLCGCQEHPLIEVTVFNGISEAISILAAEECSWVVAEQGYQKLLFAICKKTTDMTLRKATLKVLHVSLCTTSEEFL
jgi:hypothetical protein